MQMKRAFELLDEYNNPQTSETRVEQVVSQLYNAGYVIRPLKTFIIKNEVEAEVLNANSSAWGLVSRITGRPIERDKQSYIQIGDMLEYRTPNGVEQVGPVTRITEAEPHFDNRRLIIVRPAFGEAMHAVDEERIQAVFRNGVEIIRFDEQSDATTN